MVSKTGLFHAAVKQYPSRTRYRELGHLSNVSPDQTTVTHDEMRSAIEFHDLRNACSNLETNIKYQLPCRIHSSYLYHYKFETYHSTLPVTPMNE